MLNYADRMYKCDHLANDEYDFNITLKVVGDLELQFGHSSEVRLALYEARRALSAAKFLNRIEQEAIRKVLPENRIKLHSSWMSWVHTGKKRLTIREGVRGYSLGDGLLFDPENPKNRKLICISTIEKTLLKDLGEQHVHLAGHDSREDMVAGLRTHYPDITPETWVTVVRWKGEYENG